MRPMGLDIDVEDCMVCLAFLFDTGGSSTALRLFDMILFCLAGTNLV